LQQCKLINWKNVSLSSSLIYCGDTCKSNITSFCILWILLVLYICILLLPLFNIYCYRWIKFLIDLNLHDSIDIKIIVFKKSNYLLFFISLFRFVFYFCPSIFFISVYFVLFSLISYIFHLILLRFSFVFFINLPIRKSYRMVLSFRFWALVDYWIFPRSTVTDRHARWVINNQNYCI
jgi:hypothetical protein